MSSGAAAAGDGIFRCVFEGCISCSDTGIERRPYHRNCGCALHKSRRGSCGHANRSSGMHVSYPIRRSWSEGCMSLVAAAGGCSGNSSPAEVNSPARVASTADLCGKRNGSGAHLLPLCREDEEEYGGGGSVFLKV